MTAEGVSFRRFVRSVRRFGPSALLPEVAKIGAEQSLRHREGAHHYYDGRSGVTPWALAAIARESLSATERGRLASQDDVRRLCNLYANLEDPISESTDSSVDQFFVRLGFEQFRWQISEFEELSRSRALLVEAAAQVPGADLLSEETWQERLGCSVAEFVSIGFFLYVWAAQHEGVVDLSFMDLPHFAPVLERHPRDRVELLLGTRLAATIPELRDLESPRIVEENVAEHRFNPLAARPLVKMRDGRLLAPHPLLLLQRLGVNGLYYDCVGEPGFTEQLGDVFEYYVGSNLRLIQDATVVPEVDLGSRHGESVDFIVLLPNVTLLVEVKASRLTERARAGLDNLEADRKRTINRAQSQIDRTNNLRQAGHPALDFIPADKPVRGLIITLEPYWNAMSGFGPPRTGEVRSVVGSIRELEQFCASAQHLDLQQELIDLPDHSNQVLVGATGSDRTRNPILDRNWDLTFSSDR